MKSEINYEGGKKNKKRLSIKNKVVAGLLVLTMAVAETVSTAQPIYATEIQDVLPQATNVAFETARPLVYNSSMNSCYTNSIQADQRKI